MLLKMTCTFKATSIRIPMTFFIEYGEGIPKIQMKIETPNTQNNPEPKEQCCMEISRYTWFQIIES